MMSNLKPEDRKLHKAINKAMEDDDFYDTILEAAQGKTIDQLQAALKRVKRRAEAAESDWQICKAEINTKDKQIQELQAENKRLRAKIQRAYMYGRTTQQPYIEILQALKGE